MIELVILAGIVLILAIAWWQYRRACRAKFSLDTTIEGFPARVAAALQTLLETTQGEITEDSALPLSRIDYEDINGDGRKELLFQHLSGVHGCKLEIFEWREGRFKQLARICSDTPVGFEYGDFDGDGAVEIRTEKTDWSAGLPYVSSPRVVSLIRWNGSDFVEVSRSNARRLG